MPANPAERAKPAGGGGGMSAGYFGGGGGRGKVSLAKLHCPGRRVSETSSIEYSW